MKQFFTVENIIAIAICIEVLLAMLSHAAIFAGDSKAARITGYIMYAAFTGGLITGLILQPTYGWIDTLAYGEKVIIVLLWYSVCVLPFAKIIKYVERKDQKPKRSKRRKSY